MADLTEDTSYCSTHCSKCFTSHCNDNICPLVMCVCMQRTHECKLTEHKKHICRETEVSCLLSEIGCPLQMKRKDVLEHLSVCPANTIVCNMRRVRNYNVKNLLVKHLNPRESDQIHFSCYIHDIALMRRMKRSAKRIDQELRTNPHCREIEAMVESVEGCDCQSYQYRCPMYDVQTGDSETVISCGHIVRREEVMEHRLSHLCLTEQLNSVSCPMQGYGCTYKPQAIELLAERNLCSFNVAVCSLVIDWNHVTSYEVDYDAISYLPPNVMDNILDRLDSLSMRNLSCTSKRMRELCYEKLYRKGIVTFEWKSDGKGKWLMGRMIWSFSKASKFPSYRTNAKSTSDLSNHLDNCKYYAKERTNYDNLPDKLKMSCMFLADNKV
ncbi:hypothetical protein LOD99_12840 [Oopsacas minuta]|uniref:F-box only protein 30 n=1 Tax=Oopsacas minuta TaxID=111878 RepID=A0AAV7JDC7_9METZ|nr:hypothetical protein LOD99_12840 [Oopsacas minuta]